MLFILLNAAPFNNIHLNNGPNENTNPLRSNARTSAGSGNSSHNFPQQLPIENGIDFRHTTQHGSGSASSNIPSTR